MSTALVEQNDAINALLRQADKGDERAIAALRRVSEETPALWQEFGDLARHARGALCRHIAGRNRYLEEAIAKEAGRLRRAWAGDDPTPLETALAERVAACWLYLHYVEAKYLQVVGDLTYEQDTWHCRRIEQAERRYLRAIRELAQVRKIQQPTVQVNIGDKQINVAG